MAAFDALCLWGADTAAELVRRSPPYSGGILKVFGIEEGHAGGQRPFQDQRIPKEDSMVDCATRWALPRNKEYNMKRKRTMRPTSYSSVREAVQGLKERGFTDNLELADGVLHAVESGRTFTPQELTIIEHHRFEGASDPDDMAVVYGIEAADGHRGIVVDAYGVYADPRLSEFLNNVKVREEH